MFGPVLTNTSCWYFEFSQCSVNAVFHVNITSIGSFRSLKSQGRAVCHLGEQGRTKGEALQGRGAFVLQHKDRTNTSAALPGRHGAGWDSPRTGKSPPEFRHSWKNNLMLVHCPRKGRSKDSFMGSRNGGIQKAWGGKYMWFAGAGVQGTPEVEVIIPVCRITHPLIGSCHISSKRWYLEMRNSRGSSPHLQWIFLKECF